MCSVVMIVNICSGIRQSQVTRRYWERSGETSEEEGGESTVAGAAAGADQVVQTVREQWQERLVMEKLTPTQQMMSAGAGSLLVSVFMTPLDVVKIRLQAQERLYSKKCFLYSNGLMDHLCPRTNGDPPARGLHTAQVTLINTVRSSSVSNISVSGNLWLQVVQQTKVFQWYLWCSY